MADEPAFAEVVKLIHAARQRVYQAVNTELIDLYPIFLSCPQAKCRRHRPHAG
jgi:hypothetical protein